MNREQAIDIIERHIDNNIASGSLVEQALSMAIDALKAQLSQQGTTKDTISRTETAEHLRRVLDATVPITDYDEGYVDGVEVGISTVSTMPTVQPQSTVGQLNDGVQSTNLIDRQAAIRWVKTECNPYGKPTLDFESGKKVIEHLEQMPSAQPEPHEGEWVDGRCNKCGGQAPFWVMSSTYYKSDFCPCCGAKMKGATT